ncbi:MAG: carboxypeptidase regulatory-like domain-containing protein [Planctomycetes bacterium]|nr:carboxypeptidase regulatory-like domain-containing protein [Planctomycetota bacterium]
MTTQPPRSVERTAGIVFLLALLLLLAWMLSPWAGTPEDPAPRWHDPAAAPDGPSMLDTSTEVVRESVLPPARPGSLLVLAPDGSPVEGAHVHGVIGDRRFSAAPSIETGSNADGFLEIPDSLVTRLPDGAFVFHAGFAPTEWHGEDRVVLQRGVTAAGVVIDLAGQPVAGATIQMSRQHFMSRPRIGLTAGSPPTADAIFAGTSDPDGHFEIGGLVPASYCVKVRHPAMMATAINGGSLAATVPVPNRSLVLTMAPLLGCRIEFDDEQMLSCSFLYPNGFRFGGEEIEHVLGRDPMLMHLPGKAFELCGVPKMPDHDRSFFFYALLSRSGPVRIPLRLRPVSTSDYVVRHTAEPIAFPLGSVKPQITDPTGRGVGCSLTFGRGSTAHLRNEMAAGELSPSAIDWGGRGRTGEVVRLVAGSYEVSIEDEFLRHGLTARSVSVQAGRETSFQGRLPWTVSRVRLQVENPGTSWRLQIRGRLADDQTRRLTERLRDPTVEFWMPPGEYEVRAVRPEHLPIESRFTCNGRDLDRSLGAFEARD